MLVVVERAYSGAEGKRVKAGTRFFVKKTSTAKGPEGVQEITWQRWQEMQRSKLAAEENPKSPKPVAPKPVTPARRPSSAPVLDPKAKVEPPSRGAAQAKAKAATPAVKTAARPGGKTGAAAPSSSSQAARPTGSSTLKQRGNRRGQTSGGSPSTTPSDSSAGQTSSTPATPAGGGTTSPVLDSAAFD